MSSKIQINRYMEREGHILVNNDDSFPFVPSAWPQEPTICQFLGIIIYIGVYGVFSHMIDHAGSFTGK